MKFDDLDGKMRVFETAQDVCVLPDFAVSERGIGARLFQVAQRRCAQECSERALLLGLAQRRPGCRSRHGKTERDVGGHKKRVAVSARHQLQRSAKLAETWDRIL